MPWPAKPAFAHCQQIDFVFHEHRQVKGSLKMLFQRQIPPPQPGRPRDDSLRKAHNGGRTDTDAAHGQTQGGGLLSEIVDQVDELLEARLAAAPVCERRSMISPFKSASAATILCPT